MACTCNSPATWNAETKQCECPDAINNGLVFNLVGGKHVCGCNTKAFNVTVADTPNTCACDISKGYFMNQTFNCTLCKNIKNSNGTAISTS